MDWLWPEAERLGPPVATVARRFLPLSRNTAERHPGPRPVIDHLGSVRPAQDDAASANLGELLSPAALPDVAVGATGAPGYSTAPCPFRNVHDGLRRIFDAFGPRRSFWGTDISRMPRGCRRCVATFTEGPPWLSGRDLEPVMGRAVCDWIGWALPSD